MRVLLLLLLLTLPALADKYTAVDRHALAAPAEVEHDVKTLARYLCKRHYDAQQKRWVSEDPSFTDELRARAIFRWLAEFLVYDLRDRTDWDATRILELRRGACHEFAVLFQALAEAAGLECRYVGGTAKSLYFDDQAGPHAWNVVRVSKRWLPVDATWACRFAVREGKLVDEGYTEAWFLDSPEFFALSHTPDPEQFQRGYIEKQRRSHEHLARAEAKKEAGDLKGALKFCEQALEEAWSAEVFTCLADLQFKLGDSLAALRNCNLALRERPDLAEPYLTRGLIKEQRQDFKGALQDYESALKRKPGLPEAKSARKRLRRALFLAN